MRLVSNFDDGGHLAVIKQGFACANDVFVSVAFLKESGLGKIYKDIRGCVERGGRLVIVVGLSLNLTDVKALIMLCVLMDDFCSTGRLFCYVYDDNFITFHPKYYRFGGVGSFASVVLGSANLTGSGLLSNVEASAVFEINLDGFNEKGFACFEKSLIDSASLRMLSRDVCREYSERCVRDTKRFPLGGSDSVCDEKIYPFKLRSVGGLWGKGRFVDDFSTCFEVAGGLMLPDLVAAFGDKEDARWVFDYLNFIGVIVAQDGGFFLLRNVVFTSPSLAAAVMARRPLGDGNHWVENGERLKSDSYKKERRPFRGNVRQWFVPTL